MSGLLLRCVRVRCARMMCGCVCAYAGAHGCAWVRVRGCVRVCVYAYTGKSLDPPSPKKLKCLFQKGQLIRCLVDQSGNFVTDVLNFTVLWKLLSAFRKILSKNLKFF